MIESQDLNLADWQYRELKNKVTQGKKNESTQVEIFGLPLLLCHAEKMLVKVEERRKLLGKKIYEPIKNNKRCGFCDYEWVSRQDNPKACPKCKRRLDTKKVSL